MSLFSDALTHSPNPCQSRILETAYLDSYYKTVIILFYNYFLDLIKEFAKYPKLSNPHKLFK